MRHLAPRVKHPKLAKRHHEQLTLLKQHKHNQIVVVSGIGADVVAATGTSAAAGWRWYFVSKI